MKTASVADLRNDFARVELWLKQGEEIHITKRGKHVATLVRASKAHGATKPVWPDFEARVARLERLYGKQPQHDFAEIRTAQERTFTTTRPKSKARK